MMKFVAELVDGRCVEIDTDDVQVTGLIFEARRKRSGFSGHSGLSLFNRGEHIYCLSA
jgi:hypothetical protein